MIDYHIYYDIIIMAYAACQRKASHARTKKVIGDRVRKKYVSKHKKKSYVICYVFVLLFIMICCISITSCHVFHVCRHAAIRAYAAALSCHFYIRCAKAKKNAHKSAITAYAKSMPCAAPTRRMKVMYAARQRQKQKECQSKMPAARAVCHYYVAIHCCFTFYAVVVVVVIV